MRLVDLSHPLTTGMTTFPGDPAVEVSPALELARDGCAVAALRLGTHSGTHVDAPSHVVPGGASIDQLDLALFTGPAVVVDVRGARPRERIGWEPFAEHAGRLGPGVVVLVRTGWDVLFGDAEGYRDQPWLAPEVAERLVAAGVRTLGVDALSPDATGDEELRVHRAVLGAGGVIAENLRELGAVPSGPESRPWVGLLPLRVAGGDGAPVRAVAWDAADPDGSGLSGR